MKRTPAVVLGLALAVAACGGLTNGSAASPDDPVSTVATNDSSQDDPRRELREPEEGLVNIYDRPFDGHKSKGRKVTLFYVSGVDECYGLDRIKIRERRHRVVLTIFEGTHPEADACPDLGVYVKSIAILEEPLGDRKVVDGAS